MNTPRQARTRVFAALAVVCLFAALPLTTAAQSAPAKQQSPNGKIVFQSTQGGDGFVNDIYVMDADGKRQTRLTDDPADDTNPVWSPDGSKIAFFSARRGNGYELYLMDADGNNQRPLRAESPVVPFGFVWSPDGTRVAYSDGDDVYVAEVAGTAAPVNVSVFKPAGSFDREPDWSPDGGRLVVRNFTACGGCSDLHVVNASDGGGRVALSTGPGFDSNPRWSPAGDLIAYEGDRGGRGIYVTAADGTGSEAKVSGADQSFGGPTWSPDGSRVAFTNSNDNGFIDVFVVNADGSSRRADNYTKTRRADEFAYSWQKLPTQ